MMRYISVCLAFFTLACGPASHSPNDSMASAFVPPRVIVLDDGKGAEQTQADTHETPTIISPTPENAPNLERPPVDIAIAETASESNSSDEYNEYDPSTPDLPYPLKADSRLTPGVRCQHPDEIRYPEKIKYCERAVSKSVKNRVIRNYDTELGYAVSSVNRNKIKIDHYIPLCLGGDNAEANLWPQHESIYVHTDRLEGQLCVALSRGLISQNEAIDDILHAKSDIEEVNALLAKIKELL